MQRIIFFILLLTLTTALSYGQRHRELLKFKAKTVEGGLVFGVCNNKEEANKILNDFQERNVGSKFDIVDAKRDFLYTTFPVKKGEDPVKTFTYLCPKGYKVLSFEDIKALELIEKNDFKAGVTYYMNARQAEEDFVMLRFADLTVNYSKYYY